MTKKDHKKFRASKLKFFPKKDHSKILVHEIFSSSQIRRQVSAYDCIVLSIVLYYSALSIVLHYSVLSIALYSSALSIVLHCSALCIVLYYSALYMGL